VPGEPRLRQAEREEEKGAGGDAAPAPHEGNERHEPDEVLGREHPVEGDERGDGCGGREEGRLSVHVAPPGEGDPDPEDRRELERGRQVGCESGAPPPQRLGAVRRDGRERVHAEVLRRHQHCRAEALHLERSVELVGEHRAEAVGREYREGQEARRRDGDERGHVCESGGTSSLPPEVRDCDRQEDGRPELRGEAEPEEQAADHGSLAHDRGEGADREQCRPQVVAGVEEGAEDERRDADRE